MLALVAMEAYFPRDPAGFSFGGSCQFARRSASSASETSRSSLRDGMSGRIRPPGRTKAIGPPAAASGEACPMTAPGPLVPDDDEIALRDLPAEDPGARLVLGLEDHRGALEDKHLRVDRRGLDHRPFRREVAVEDGEAPLPAVGVLRETSSIRARPYGTPASCATARV